MTRNLGAPRKDGFVLLRFLERLLFDLGLKRTHSRVFELDDELNRSVQALAQREGRAPGEVASGLVAEALDHRRMAEKSLHLWKKLSPREQEVAALACLNYTNSEIAQKLTISRVTVKTHLRHILDKAGLRRKEDLRQALVEWDFSAWEAGGKRTGRGGADEDSSI
jgi:DNA-binding CsgD family transcriptional regulator